MLGATTYEVGTATYMGMTTPVWIHVINLLQVAIALWLLFVLLLGSWKLFRFLIKWKP